MYQVLAIKHQPRSIAIAATVLLIALSLTWMPYFDWMAHDYLRDVLVTNMAAYTTTLAISGIISVIQSIEIGFSFVASGTMNPGEIFQPLKELVERFSTFIFYGLAGLVVQQIVLSISASLLTKTVLSLVIFGGFILWFFRVALPSWFKGLLVLMLMLRFAFAIEVGASWALDRLYFDEQQQQASSKLEEAWSYLQIMRDQSTETIADEGIVDYIEEFTSGFYEMFTSIDDAVALTADAVVQLAMIIVLRSIVFPILFIWLICLIIVRLPSLLERNQNNLES